MQSEQKQPSPIPKKPDYIVKCVIFGAPNSGKSNFLARMCHDSYSGLNSNTMGIDFVSKTITMSQKLINMIFWEVEASPNNQSDSILQLCSKGSILIVLMYSINSSESFSYIQKILKSLNNLGVTAGIMILGNKADTEQNRKIDRQIAEKLAFDEIAQIQSRIIKNTEVGFLKKKEIRKGWVLFEEISSKESINLQKVFSEMYSYIYRTITSY